MRRMWAAGAAIVVCLVIGGMPAAAQEASPEPTGPAHVTGTETIHSNVVVDSKVQVGDVMQWRGVHATSDEAASDPRVSGAGTIDGNIDIYGMNGVQRGTFRIENDGGAWEGTFRGAIYGGYLDNGTAWLVGSGDYEGLTY